MSGLDGIGETDDHLVIGARATHRQIHENEIIQDRYPGIVDVTSTIGDPQVRNWGTIGGSVAHADPASDWPAFLLATNATIVCTSQAGERTIAARDFFLDTFTTAIEPTEVLTQIRMSRRPKLAGGAYEKLERKVGDFATVGVAVFVRLGRGRRRSRAPGSASPGSPTTPFAATDAEAILVGQRPVRRAVPAGRRGRRRAGRSGRRRPRSRRIQAGDGRGDDPQGHPHGRPARTRLRVGRPKTMSTQHISVTVNGTAQEADVEARLLLVHFLRDTLGLTGTHVGCDTSHCGACTVHLDGESAKSCTVLAVQADGHEVKTIEGMADGATLHPLQQAFWDQHGLQCGFCTPGDDHAVGLAARREPGSHRSGDPRGDQRQPVSLYRLREHREVHPAGRRRDGGGCRDPDRFAGRGRLSGE